MHNAHTCTKYQCNQSILFTFLAVPSGFCRVLQMEQFLLYLKGDEAQSQVLWVLAHEKNFDTSTYTLRKKHISVVWMYKG